ncbi:uncharacterized protein ARMOST_11348 [Armillaria ostoyae]|uniref:Uncharacterized protein n=1 Tax=Armillaria ostoyae TaxID=47428 RepID=A0A284RGW4_ARMOS|nr:uncharacterized protein ARMOST_11348 [Armillaria ostoyae]
MAKFPKKRQLDKISRAPRALDFDENFFQESRFEDTDLSETKSSDMKPQKEDASKVRMVQKPTGSNTRALACHHDS